MGVINVDALLSIGIGLGVLLGGYGLGKTKLPLTRRATIENDIKTDERINNICPDDHCHETVIITRQKVETLEKGQDKIFEKLDDMPIRVVNLLRDTKGLL